MPTILSPGFVSLCFLLHLVLTLRQVGQVLVARARSGALNLSSIFILNPRLRLARLQPLSHRGDMAKVASGRDASGGKSEGGKKDGQLHLGRC